MRVRVRVRVRVRARARARARVRVSVSVRARARVRVRVRAKVRATVSLTSGVGCGASRCSAAEWTETNRVGFSPWLRVCSESACACARLTAIVWSGVLCNATSWQAIKPDMRIAHWTAMQWPASRKEDAC